MTKRFEHLTDEEVKLARAGYALEGLWFLNKGKVAELATIWAEREAINNKAGMPVIRFTTLQ